MVFSFRAQPLKAFYLLYTFSSVLFIRLPFWLITFTIPSFRPRASWSLISSVTIRVIQTFVATIYEVGYPDTPFDPSDLARKATKPHVVPVDGLPTKLVVKDIASAAEKNGVTPVTVCGYWMGKDGKPLPHSPPKASEGERVFYWLHGGGHVSGSGDPGKDTALVYPAIMEKANDIISRVFSIEYRISAAEPFTPANPFPAALLDVIAGYRYLLQQGFKPDNIIVFGVSAGGHLAVQLALYLAQAELPELPLPGALLLLSPTVDWAGTHDNDPSCSMIRNRNCDLVGPILQSKYTARALVGSLPPDEIAVNPYLSPASLSLPVTKGLYQGFPHTFIFAGDAEQTLDPMRTFRDRLVADIGADSVRYIEYPNAHHAFMLSSIFGPERDQAIVDVTQWLSELAAKN